MSTTSQCKHLKTDKYASTKKLSWELQDSSIFAKKLSCKGAVYFNNLTNEFKREPGKTFKKKLLTLLTELHLKS